jgi:phosphoribosylformimino-5-aminoimidazole carboxamide ribotide isomerase
VQIIPAIDIFQNQCVRLTGGIFSQRTTYGSDPDEMAEQFLRDGASYLHVVDLEGSKEGKVTNWQAIRAVAACCAGRMQVGGGVRTVDEIDRLLHLGVDRVVVGSVALTSPQTLDEWIRRYGAERFCIALDVRDGGIAYAGWQKLHALDIHAAARAIVEAGVQTILSTDITRDGRMSGPNLSLYTEVVSAFPGVRWLASGGVHTKADIEALRTIGLSGVVIGKALYEGSLDLREILRS